MQPAAQAPPSPSPRCQRSARDRTHQQGQLLLWQFLYESLQRGQGLELGGGVAFGQVAQLLGSGAVDGGGHGDAILRPCCTGWAGWRGTEAESRDLLSAGEAAGSGQ